MPNKFLKISAAFYSIMDTETAPKNILQQRVLLNSNAEIYFPDAKRVTEPSIVQSKLSRSVS